MTEIQKIVSSLLAIARAAHTALDDSEERPIDNGASGNTEHVISADNFANLEAHLASLDNLPEAPNTVMTGPARAEYALRELMEPRKVPDWMRVLVFAELKERLAQPDADEAHIGAEELLRELNEIFYATKLNDSGARVRGGEYGHAKYGRVLVIGSHPHDGALRICEAVEPGLEVGDDGKTIYIACERSDLSPLETQGQWPYLGLCQDEGCPHHGTPHVCLNLSEADREKLRDAITQGQEPMTLAQPRFLHNVHAFVSDAIINDITINRIGKWPSFEAQSWACSVVRAVLLEGVEYRSAREAIKSSPQYLMRQADTLAKLRALCGFVENGSSESVAVAQDDATGWWTVYVGTDSISSKRRTYSAQWFDEAIRKAAEAEGEPT